MTNQEQSEQPEIELQTALGRVTARGKIMLKIFVVAVVVGAIYMHDREQGNRDKTISSKLDAVTYVLTLTEAERKGLKLMEPSEIRRMHNREPER